MAIRSFRDPAGNLCGGGDGGPARLARGGAFPRTPARPWHRL